MIRFALALLTAAFLLTGCTTTLKFPLGSPYPTPHGIDDGVVISFPDLIVKQNYSVKVGAFIDQQVFKIPVYDAYRTETVARMNGLFTRGVTLVVHSTLDEISDQEMVAVASDEQKAAADGNVESKLDKILSDMEAKQEGDKTVKKSKQELMDEAIQEAAKESADQKNNVYLLKFKDALLGFSDSRLVITFNAQLYDRRTGALLLEKRYRGLSSRFEPGNNNKTNEARLLGLTKQAFSGSMSTLVDDIAQVTGNWNTKN